MARKKPTFTQIVEGKHWRLNNDTGERIEVEIVLGNGTRIINEVVPDGVLHLIPAEGEKIDVHYRWFDDGPRLELV
ncbi:hypothetical protein [Azotobacter armeniacus]